MKYNLTYKYYIVKTQNKDIIIELSYDNTMNKEVFSAKTNTKFMDENGDRFRACGIGDNETDALEMCLNEIKEFYDSNINVSMVKEIDLPFKISVEIKSNIATCYFKKKNNQLLILTDKNLFELPLIDNIVLTIEKNLKFINGSEYKNFTKEYLQDNDFYPVFDSLTC